MKSPFLFVGLFMALMFSGVYYLTQPIFGNELNIETYLEEVSTMKHQALLEHFEDYRQPLNANLEPPLYPGCTGVKPFPRKIRCSFTKLGEFFNDHIETERFHGQRGIVILKFHVPVNGKLRHIRLEEDTNAHLAAELVRIFGVMQGKDIYWDAATRSGKKIPMDMAFKFDFTRNQQGAFSYDFDLLPLLP